MVLAKRGRDSHSMHDICCRLWTLGAYPTSDQLAVLFTTNLTLLADNPFAFVMDRVQRMVLISWPMGLFLLPCLRLPRRSCTRYRFRCLPDFRAREFSVNGSVLPAHGDVLDRTGYVMWYYNASPIWNEAVWTILGIVSALCLSMYIQWLLERAVAWGRLRQKTGAQADGAQMLYILAGLIVIAVFAVSPGLNDRYCFL